MLLASERKTSMYSFSLEKPKTLKCGDFEMCVKCAVAGGNVEQTRVIQDIFRAREQVSAEGRGQLEPIYHKEGNICKGLHKIVRFPE